MVVTIHDDFRKSGGVLVIFVPFPKIGILVVARMKLKRHTAMCEHQRFFLYRRFFLSPIRKDLPRNFQTRVAAKVGSPS
jgi:hypothetical protein